MSLSLNDVVNVSVSLSPNAPSLAGFGVMMVVVDNAVIDTSERIRFYTSIDDVAVDFLTSSNTYKMAQKYFAQSPQPVTIAIGRWAKAASSGLLKTGELAAADQVASAWTAITDGAFKCSFDGTLRTFTAITFAGCANMNAVAVKIDTAITTYGTCTWDAVRKIFIITAKSTGATSTVSYLTTAGAGTEIAHKMMGLAADGGTIVDGIAAESITTAMGLLNLANGNWYTFVISETLTDQINLDASAWAESNGYKQYGFTSADSDILDPVSSADIFSLIQATGAKRTHMLYNADLNSVPSPFAKAGTVDFNGQNTTLTLMFKTMPLVTASTSLTETQRQTILDKGGNFYGQFSDAQGNLLTFYESGQNANGDFFDTIQGLDWLRDAVQKAILTVLYTSTTKIPQTDAGVQQLISAAAAACEQGVTNGLMAPGVWSGPDVGQVKTGDILRAGYYIYAASVNDQSQSDRDARKAPLMQILIKLAGAIQHSDVTITVQK